MTTAAVVLPPPFLLILVSGVASAAASSPPGLLSSCSLPPVAGYFCASGYCGCDGPTPHHPSPQCGPSMAELRLGGATTADKVRRAKQWCDGNSTCRGFALDPRFPVTLAFSGENLTQVAQPNAEWTIFWRGAPQPLPPRPPAPPPPPPAPPPSPWTPILPTGPCSSDEDCSLNGKCTDRSCVCTASWMGHNCQFLALGPVPKVAGYGWSPNVSSWGGSIYHNASDPKGLYHLYVTEETGGKGLASWISNSQIVHAVSQTPLGPFQRKDVVSKPPTTNPQVLHDPSTGTFLLFHIRGAGSFQLFVSTSVDGPWLPHDFSLGGCNNPTASFHPNGTLFVLCHDSHFSLYSFRATGQKPAWEGHRSAPIPTLVAGKRRNAPGNCEDPFLYFDRFGRFHVVAHCYTCYWYPLTNRPGHSSKNYPHGRDSCMPGSAFCSAHGFSTTGEAGNWTWIGGGHAPYNFTSAVVGGGAERSFSTRERPWGLLGGPHGDEWLALVNGVSGGVGRPGEFIKYIAGRDWTYTNIQPVRHTETTTGDDSIGTEQ